jgi:alkaline phosphatase D
MAITGDWDRRINRRTLLKTGGSFAAGMTLVGLAGGRAFAQASFDGYPFKLGVASGDPTPMGVVLWTRLAPEPLLVGGGLGDEDYEVRYEVARDEDFRHIHEHGTTVALADEAHSVRVELDGLPPEREWFYRFKAGDHVSPAGRTRTTPPGNSQLDTLNLAFVSCQNFAHGFFTPYDDLAAADIDAVIFLGDYIYEGPGLNLVRAHTPAREILTLDEYRIRHGQYKTDERLQRAHAAHPWLVTWDDHEFRNNYANLDINSPQIPIEDIRKRRAAAYQAYWEHMPLARARKPVEENFQLYRRFHWGKLVTFNVLDGRQYRSDQPLTCTAAQRDPSGYCPDNLNPERTMLGAEQRDWLLADLATTKTRWNVLAQQTAFAPFNRPVAGRPVNFTAEADNWDGYVADRQRIIDCWVEQATPNPVVLTGDSHIHRISNVPPDYRRLDGAAVATELMGTSISTDGDPNPEMTRFADDPANPHVLFRDNHRGYVRCTVTPESWTAEFRRVTTVRQPQADVSTIATFVIEDGVPGAHLVAPAST